MCFIDPPLFTAFIGYVVICSCAVIALTTFFKICKYMYMCAVHTANVYVYFTPSSLVIPSSSLFSSSSCMYTCTPACLLRSSPSRTGSDQLLCWPIDSLHTRPPPSLAGRSDAGGRSGKVTVAASGGQLTAIQLPVSATYIVHALHIPVAKQRNCYIHVVHIHIHSICSANAGKSSRCNYFVGSY